jgi:hypothetical protein
MAEFSPVDDLAAAARAGFTLRAPSTAWEQISLGPGPDFFWIWFKPPIAPQGLILRIPPETYRGALHGAGPAGESLSLRKLLRAAGIDPQIVSLWYLYGVPCESRGGTAPTFDQPLAEPAAGADPNIVVLVDAPGPAIPPAEYAPATKAAMSANLVQVFDEMEADWFACQVLEKQLLLARKQLTTALVRLAALDRDLSPEERLHGDRQDKSDWQEVRRSLKDAATKLNRYVKEHDVGETSAAGKKVWFTEVFRKFVEPKRPCEEIFELHREFEAYRKRLQLLLQNMGLAHTNVAQEAERRAQQVISRLISRARTAQHKTTGWTPHRWLNYKQRDSI